MAFPVDGVIQFTLNKMNERIRQHAEGAPVNEQSGLIFMGNVHDAVPRRLFLDSRLSALDKMAWVMIRLYAQSNEGAVFPTYDELQLQLASPHAGKASRETVSRALLMLRLTGWLSLCKRVRDASGRIRGNIYAQHDEPLSAHDAEVFDPGWLDAVEEACRHGNRTVRLTALAVLQSLKSDSAMRHRHSRVAIIEVRLSGYQSPQAMANSRREQDELTHAQNRTQSESPGSETELSTQMGENKPGSDPELSRKTRGCDPVRKPNRYVIRTSTQCVEKNTYTAPAHDPEQRLRWPTDLLATITTAERDALEPQLLALPEQLGQELLSDVGKRLQSGEVRNAAAYLIGTLKRAKQGQFNRLLKGNEAPMAPESTGAESASSFAAERAGRASPDAVAGVMAKLREMCTQ